MFFNLIICILMLSSQAFADATNHFAGYTSASAIDQFQTVELNGNVGIGTAAPSSALFIYGSNYPAAMTLSAASGVDNNTELMLSLNNNVTDSSQNAYTVTNNNVTFSNTSPEFPGTYYGVFNGTNAYLTVPNASPFNMGSNNFTIDFWFKTATLPASGNFYILVSKEDATDMNGYYIDLNNTAGTYGLVANAQLSNTAIVNMNATITPSVNTWYHIAWVRNGSAWNLYLNGSSIANATSSSSIGTNTTAFTIGAFNNAGTLSNYTLGNFFLNLD